MNDLAHTYFVAVGALACVALMCGGVYVAANDEGWEE